MKKGGCDFKELERFLKNMEGLTQNLDEILDICARELTQRFLRKVIKRTQVGVYPAGSGRKGGTLRRGWSTQNTRIYHSASSCLVEIINPVEYASYVEYGHRTRGGKGWVKGRFMMTISAEEIERDTPLILSKKLKKLMEAQLK